MRILHSFSTGRSSAIAGKLLREKYPDAEIVSAFGNTGLEHPRSIKFGKQCDEYFGWNTVCVEAVVSPEMNEGTRHKIATWDTLAMKGEPMEAVIRKYGIPNEGYPHCTRETKENPIKSYLRSIGWEAGTYLIALGMRADEPDRTKNRDGRIYPLADAGMDKRDVLDFWADMPFDLEIKEREGNCTSCWKKSDTKHVLNIQHNPEWYEFFDRMEREYSLVRPERGPQFFFRGHRSTAQLVKLAQWLPMQMEMILQTRPEEDEGCAKECQPFAAP